MGRDILVAFQSRRPHAVVLLDAIDAAPDVSNRVTAGKAMHTLAGKGISVAAPASGAWNLMASSGAAQGGTDALMMATFQPDRYRYGGSMSGFLTPSSTTFNGAITAGLAQYGGVDTCNMWGLPQLGRWKWHDPTCMSNCWSTSEEKPRG
jgi:S-formylglutathione hydrolase FrmB